MNIDESPISDSDTFSLISPTAKLVAFYRQYSDIPFAREISDATGAEAVVQTMLEAGAAHDGWRHGSILLEARYKSITSAIKKHGITQVLEFASGLSFRSILMSREPNMIYVETDLPGIMEDRERVVAKIPALSSAIKNGKAFFHSVNALNFDEIEPVLTHFDPAKPVAIVHEGLFMYLTMEEKGQLARNVKKILQRFGGVWITPDLQTATEREKLLQDRDPAERASIQKFEQVIEKLTGRKLGTQVFKNEDHLFAFFDNLGFEFKESLQIDGSYELTSRAKDQPSQQEFDALRSMLKLWTITVS